MNIQDVKNLDFVIDEGSRLRISSRKATNTLVFDAVMQTLKNEGYIFYRLFQGGYIYAEKQR